MNAAPHRFDLVVVGAGMVGAAFASLMARAGCSVAVVEGREPPPFDPAAEFGLRVSAISPGSAAILEQAGAWQDSGQSRHAPYLQMIVEDHDGKDSLHFEAPAFGLERLGTIVENDLLQSALWRSLASNAMVTRWCPDEAVALATGSDAARLQLASGATLEAELVVAADGAASRIRKLAGLGQDVWEYDQQGVVCVVRTARRNPGIAWQRFVAGNPLAFLPLPDGRSSIVWTCARSEAERRCALDEAAFRMELQEASREWLGRVEAVGPRAAFGLQMRLSRRYVGDRLVLLGDAAHVVHPLAGQGVNLGLADAAALVETLVRQRRRDGSLADPVALRRFERWRRSESELMAGGIHALRAVFQHDALSAVRRFGMRRIAGSWLARERFLQRACGLGRNAPGLARGKDLRTMISGESRARRRDSQARAG